MTRDQLLRSAEKHIAKGKFEAALKDYLRVVDENPRDISTLNKVGDLYVRLNRGFDPRFRHEFDSRFDRGFFDPRFHHGPGPVRFHEPRFIPGFSPGFFSPF